jgi:hypothetical protein
LEQHAVDAIASSLVSCAWPKDAIADGEVFWIEPHAVRGFSGSVLRYHPGQGKSAILAQGGNDALSATALREIADTSLSDSPEHKRAVVAQASKVATRTRFYNDGFRPSDLFDDNIGKKSRFDTSERFT